MKQILSQDRIKQYLPHRDAMLLLHRLEILETGQSIGYYHFSGEEWFFKGHFPGHPIVPGVVSCEVMAQSSCGLWLDELPGGRPLLTGITDMKFHKEINPGDILSAVCQVEKVRPSFYYVTCKAYVDKKLCVSGRLSFIIQNTDRHRGDCDA